MTESVFYVFEQRGDVPDNNDLWIGAMFCTQSEIQKHVEELAKLNGKYYYYIRL